MALPLIVKHLYSFRNTGLSFGRGTTKKGNTPQPLLAYGALMRDASPLGNIFVFPGEPDSLVSFPVTSTPESLHPS